LPRQGLSYAAASVHNEAMTDTQQPAYLTTKELAELLRIKERKVYDLAAAGEVPCVRVVGKLLFPRSDVEAWIAASRSGPSVGAAPLPLLLAGSHDPLLEWALRESGSGIPAFFDGSLDGLARLERRDAMACGMHVREADNGWNVETVRQAMPDRPVVVMEFAQRQRGLIVAAGNPHGVAGIGDVAPLRCARRQSGAGSQRLFEELVRGEGIDPATLAGPVVPARTENDVALIVLDGSADVAFGLAAVAAQMRLGFVPLVEERFDLVLWRQAYFEKPFQAFLRFAASDAFRQRAAAMPGYAVGGFGTIHHNGPGI
jgi:putative molybdopterin biosynthesis protein